MYKHILIPTDGSDLSEKAIKNGIEFAKKINARVTGFYAAPQYRPEIYEDAMPVDVYSRAKFEQRVKEAAEKHLAVISDAAKAAGIPCECFYVPSDSPYEAIIKAAQDKGCDLIFMASHGRKGIAGLLLGSETTKVLTHSRIPVLVYR